MKPGGPPREVESKLSIADRPTFLALARLRQIGAFKLGAWRRQRLITCYWDTRSGDLQRTRTALRTRTGGDNVEATLKGPRRVRGLLHDRTEITVALPVAPRGRWARLPAELAAQLGKVASRGPFLPLLITDIERRSCLIHSPGANRGAVVAELALDRVRVRAPGERRATLAYWELEVEDRCGGRRQILAVTAELRRHFGLRPSPLSKLERGMAALRSAGKLRRSFEVP